MVGTDAFVLPPILLGRFLERLALFRGSHRRLASASLRLETRRTCEQNSPENIEDALPFPAHEQHN